MLESSGVSEQLTASQGGLSTMEFSYRFLVQAYRPTVATFCADLPQYRPFPHPALHAVCHAIASITGLLITFGSHDLSQSCDGPARTRSIFRISNKKWMQKCGEEIF
jgi:hypothetical protein